jgi:hypothetical protein
MVVRSDGPYRASSARRSNPHGVLFKIETGLWSRVDDEESSARSKLSQEGFVPVTIQMWAWGWDLWQSTRNSPRIVTKGFPHPYACISMHNCVIGCHDPRVKFPYGSCGFQIHSDHIPRSISSSDGTHRVLVCTVLGHPSRSLHCGIVCSCSLQNFSCSRSRLKKGPITKSSIEQRTKDESKIQCILYRRIFNLTWIIRVLYYKIFNVNYTSKVDRYGYNNWESLVSLRESRLFIMS